MPEGAKGDPFTLGVLALVAVPVVLPKLVEFLQAWALRSEKRSVKIKTPAGLRDIRTWVPRALGALVLDRESFRQVVADPFATGPMLLILLTMLTLHKEVTRT